MKKSLALRLILGWTALCAIWMAYVVGLDLLAVIRSGDAGGYGIFVDRKLLIIVSAIPLQLISTVALMDVGRKVALVVEILAALGYCFMAFVLWRNSRLAKVTAVSFFILSFLLLAVYLGYIIPMFWSAWGATFGLFAIVTGAVFLVANGWAIVYFLLPHAKRLAPSAT